MKNPLASASYAAFAAALIAGPIGNLHAQTPAPGPWYVGAGGGVSKLDVDTDFRNALVPGFGGGFTTDIDDEDTGWKVYAGYRALPWLALEASYTDYGKAKLRADATLPAARIDATWEAEAWALDLLPTFEMDRFSLFARLGAAFYRVRTEATTAFTGGVNVDGNAKKNSVAFKWGGGGAFQFTPNLGLRVEYEQFEAGNSSTGKGDVSLLSASLLYRF